MIDWNKWGFGGACVGGAAWMVGPLVFGLGVPSLVAVVGILSCAFCGVTLWRNRNRLSAHRGIQIQLLVSALAAAAVMIACEVDGSLARLDPRLADSPRQIYAGLLIYPALALYFWQLSRGRGNRAPEEI